MITKNVKISKLLKEYPGSLDVLLNVSPHFNKLQNKILRKALAGRVTIEQAASIAGVDLTNLLTKLNNSNSTKKSILEAEKKENFVDKKITNEKPDFLNSISEEKIITFDVRPILDSGKDPLKDILSKAKNLNLGETLLIINSFEPIPLYSLLEKKGFIYWTEKVNDTFKVYFYKVDETKITDENPAKENNAMSINEKDFENIIEMNVHDLQPPEPMMKILENLNKVDEKTVMRVFHHREPQLLYPKLEERGYFAFCEKLGEDSFKILIAKKRL